MISSTSIHKSITIGCSDHRLNTMALIHCRFQSLVLSLEMSVIIIMPENKGGVRQGGEPIKGDCPVLYLLHGYSTDESDWIRKSGIKRYADYCGIQDSLYPINVKFRDHLRTLDYDFVYDEDPGDHDWDYWDPAIQRIVKWLPIQP